MVHICHVLLWVFFSENSNFCLFLAIRSFGTAITSTPYSTADRYLVNNFGMVASTYYNFQWCFQAERFLEPINDKINLYNNHKTIFNILSNINTSVSTKNAPKDVLGKGAKECIKLGESFPFL